MSAAVNLIGAQGAATASSTLTWSGAITIFVLVIAGLLILVAFVGRRSQRLSYRPRPKQTQHIEEFREAAEADVEAIEESDPTPRNGPGFREDDL
ncbi:MAG TPA: hypothetical protein VMH35_18285 [Streptosporangiaceae bacterium]|nr:hypothetical protein [Streptosporangiaceae bacterium]